jgi:glycosyltransferase involved in cell wall biosynthesis
MRIVNVIQCTNLGGMEQASLRLMKALMARGHELSIISLNPIAGLGPLLKEAGIPAVGLDYSRCGKIGAFFDLRRALQAESADALIMTGHNFAASLALGDAGRGRRLLACHYHHEGVMPPWRWRLIYRIARARFQSITFPSDTVRWEAEAIAPFISPVARTIRNPLPPPTVDPSLRVAFRAGLGVGPATPLIGNAGWLIQRKRFDIFLDTAAEILKLQPHAHFAVAGDGELRSALEAQAARLGIASRLAWLGWLRDLDPFYAALDVLLFNTDWDTFPTTPVEAMSRAIPVVASSIQGGLPELLDDETGWLLDRHDPAALAKAAITALGPEGRARGSRARGRVTTMSDPATIAAQIEELLIGAGDTPRLNSHVGQRR